MELRHLRYFVAVAEAGSLTVAAESRLHTAQPSLSRQIRDLEYEVGVPLFTRSPRGVELTPAGLVFLDHARLALAQADAGVTAARRAAQPAKACFALGFLTGQEMAWLPAAMHILREQLPNIDVTVSSQYSPDLADGLLRGKLDLAFMRPEPQMPGLDYRTVVTEPLVVLLPSDHRLAARKSIAVQDRANLAADYRDLSARRRSRYPPGAPARQSRHGDVARRLDPWGDAGAGLRAEFHAVVSHQPAACGRFADDRSRRRLQQGQQIADPQIFYVENRGSDCAGRCASGASGISGENLTLLFFFSINGVYLQEYFAGSYGGHEAMGWGDFLGSGL
jgi:DNA-binding transcriptional LysR family regulator